MMDGYILYICKYNLVSFYCPLSFFLSVTFVNLCCKATLSILKIAIWIPCIIIVIITIFCHLFIYLCLFLTSSVPMRLFAKLKQYILKFYKLQLCYLGVSIQRCKSVILVKIYWLRFRKKADWLTNWLTDWLTDYTASSTHKWEHWRSRIGLCPETSDVSHQVKPSRGMVDLLLESCDEVHGPGQQQVRLVCQHSLDDLLGHVVWF